MKTARETFRYGKDEVIIETGVIARQATSAVTVTIDKTMVLVTLVANKDASDIPFFPLGVHYIEKTYATGKIPGGFFKREARPSEKEVLTSRLIDRPLRPLFPKEFRNEIQVICTVVSSDKDRDPDIAAMLGAAAAMALSGLPVSGILGGARVGYDDKDNYILNPSYTELKTSRLDMVVAGTKDAVLMVESEAQELSESVMLGAIEHAHKEMQVAIGAIEKLAKAAGSPTWDWSPPQSDAGELRGKLEKDFAKEIEKAYEIKDKTERKDQLSAIKDKATEKYVGEDNPDDGDVVAFILEDISSNHIREKVLSGGARIDGRDVKTVRPIDVKVGILPSAHGSALFTRGETQALVAATLASTRHSQIIDALEGEYKDNFLFHYNFPPFCVGEISFIGSPKRREIGHGRLAKRGVKAMLPEAEEFPYTLRVVSEITESNGSSSMASVCGSSLALMDAGVPVKNAVAGIAMGLVLEGDKYKILTDIMGDEDHLGDMDFKVAGTSAGVTALQMDIKITGVTTSIMDEALKQANEARMHILGEMAKALDAPRDEISPRAPYMKTFTVDPDKVRDIIGKGGNVIRAIIERTGAEIDIEDNVVSIYGENRDSAVAAQKEIDEIVAEPEVNHVYEGTVSRLADFGAFVDIIGNNTGLVHISEIAKERVEKVEDYLKVGQKVRVKVLELGDRGRIRLSVKEASQL